MGSFNLFDSYNQIDFKKDKIQINSFYNFKKGNGYRPNSNFRANNIFAQLIYKPTTKSSLKAEVTYYRYLAKQAGGLTDLMFAENPRQSTRDRNWFEVDWKLYNLVYEHNLFTSSKISLSLYALDAERNALGYRGNPIYINENPILFLDEKDANGQYINPRDLIKSNFNNYGAEFRFVNQAMIFNKKSIWLAGVKWYEASNSSQQGPGIKRQRCGF